MTGSQIRAALRQDKRLRADPALWEQISLRAQREMPRSAASAENSGRIRLVMQRAIRQVPLHYGLAAACVLAIAVSVSALVAAGRQANPFSSASGALSRHEGSAISIAGSLPAGAQPSGGWAVAGGSSSQNGGRSSGGSAALPSSSRASSKVSPSSSASSGAVSPGASGNSVSSGSSSAPAGSASSGPAGTVRTQSSSGDFSGANIPANPFFLSYRGKIYSTSGVFGFHDTALATPGVILGHFATSDANVLSGRAVYAVNGVDRSKQLCIPDVNDSTKFGRYFYLCGRTFSLGGVTYSLSGGQITDVNATTAMQNDTVGGFSATDGGTITASGGGQASALNDASQSGASDVPGASDCILTLLVYPSSDITSHLHKIGSLSPCNVYSIAGIDPSAAIVLSGNSRWFLAVSTNYKNINYGDLQNLIAQKGLTLDIH